MGLIAVPSSAPLSPRQRARCREQTISRPGSRPGLRPAVHAPSAHARTPKGWSKAPQQGCPQARDSIMAGERCAFVGAVVASRFPSPLSRKQAGKNALVAE